MKTYLYVIVRLVIASSAIESQSVYNGFKTTSSFDSMLKFFVFIYYACGKLSGNCVCSIGECYIYNNIRESLLEL